MAFDIGAITGALVLDKSKWESAIEKAKADTKNLEGAILRNADACRNWGLALTAAGAGITAMNVKLVSLAARVQLTETLFSASFGKMSNAALGWSKSLSKSFTLNTSDIQKSLAQFNNLARGMNVADDASLEMSKSLTVLSVEMSRFFGLSQEDAAGRLQQALAGMTRPLRELGIVIKENAVQEYALTHGIIKQGETLSEAQAVLVRYNLLLEKTKFIQGTLGESSKNLSSLWSTFKGQVEEVGETFGAALIPVTSSILQLFTRMTTALNDLAQRFPALTSSIVISVAAFGIFATGAGALLLILPKIAAAAVAMGTSVGALSLTFLEVAAAIGAVVLAVQNFDLVKSIWYSFAEGVNRALSQALAGLSNFMSALEKLPGVTQRMTGGIQISLNEMATKLSESADLMSLRAAESIESQMQKTNGLKSQISVDTSSMQKDFEKMWQGATDAARKASADQKNWFQQMVSSFNIVEEAGKRTFNLLSDTLSSTFYDLTFKISSLQDIAARFGENIIRMLFDIAAQWMALKIMMGFAGNMVSVGGAVAGVGAIAPASNFAVSSANLPSFDTGISNVPYDMIARIHKGERVVPAEDVKSEAIELTIYNILTPQEVARAMSEKEGKGVIVNTFETNYGRGGITRRTVKRG